jgi:hypothetical protein
VPDYALCRANAFAAAILATPASSLGGDAKKAKLVRLSSAAVKLLQKAISASPRQRRANLRGATNKLQKAVKVLQRLVNNGTVLAGVGNPLITLGRSTAIAVSALR